MPPRRDQRVNASLTDCKENRESKERSRKEMKNYWVFYRDHGANEQLPVRLVAVVHASSASDVFSVMQQEHVDAEMSRVVLLLPLSRSLREGDFVLSEHGVITTFLYQGQEKYYIPQGGSVR